MDSNQNQPSEVKEGGALEAAVERMQALAGSYVRIGADQHAADLRTVLDALAARPPSMERGEAVAALRLIKARTYSSDRGQELKAESVAAIYDIATLALTAAPSPAPSAVEMAGVDRERDLEHCRAILEKCLATAVEADPQDAPFPLVEQMTTTWFCAQAEAFRHALEMLPSKADDRLLALATASREKGSSAARELKPAADTSAAEQPKPHPEERDLFEAWAERDNMDLAAEMYEERTPDNGCYYISESTNCAYIGWRERAALTPASMPQTGGEA